MYRKKKRQKSGYSPEEKTIVENVRRSQLSVSNDFELKKISRPQEGFLDCSVEEDQENLFYDIQGRVFVKSRDVYGAEKEYSEEEFLRK